MEPFWGWGSDDLTLDTVKAEIAKPFHLQTTADPSMCLAYDAANGLSVMACNRSPEQEWSRVAQSAISNIVTPEADEEGDEEQVDETTTVETTEENTGNVPNENAADPADPGEPGEPATPATPANGEETGNGEETVVDTFMGGLGVYTLWDLMFWALVLYIVYTFVTTKKLPKFF